jgi:hypothetical protein
MLRDEHGLYLEVSPKGTRSWRFRYWVGGKEHKISFGQYPLISLREAREKRDKARAGLIDGIAPSARARSKGDAPTFRDVCAEWEKTKIIPSMSAAYAEDISARVRNHADPFFGELPIAKITSLDLLQALRRIEASGHAHMAHRVLQICSQIFRYGIATGVCEGDPASALKGTLRPHAAKHRAAITKPGEVAPCLGP